ncbi:TolC family protein [Tunicatimonas pelagia]|uniref:TolC family protein n=1 Tax=Tunicatimonas pelagia TaxID=931531 RepID=UPI00266534D0|nr:TolC family protein [Tunicatimonas pelagia]WKN43382.1 TolC family protein [Tunicatimonas pelagia]
MNRIPIVVLMVLTILPAYGQTVLDDYVELGLKNNQQLIREQLGTQLAAEKEKEARGRYLPDVALDASYTWAQGGRIIDVPAGDLVNPAYEGLNQILGENRYPTNIPNVSEQFLPNNFHETKIRIIQPILNSRIYYGYKAQTAQRSAQQAQQAAYENQLIKEIKTAYFQHLAAREQLSILTDTKDLLEELLRVNQRLVANDKATPEIVYAARADVSEIESQLANARKQINTSRIFFNYLLSRDLGDSILVDATTTSPPSSVSLSLNSLQQQALADRHELAQLRYGMEASNLAVKLNRSFLLPEITAVADVGFQGFDYTFDDDQDFWLVQLGLTWPIFQGGQNRSRVQQAVLGQQQLESELVDLQQRITLEVSQSYYEWQEAQQILEFRQDERQFAQETFRIISKKYRQDQAILVELQEARTNFTTAQLSESIARYDLKIKEAALEAAINLP